MTRFNGEIFATTRWTVVLAAGGRGTPQANVALEELCRTYWYPLYVYVRRQGHSREDAEDFTQAFFTRLLEKNYLEGISNDGGKCPLSACHAPRKTNTSTNPSLL